MQKCSNKCLYVRGKSRPRTCIVCGVTEGSAPSPTLQEKVLKKVKKFYLQGAVIRNQVNCIKINAFVLVDADLEFFKEIEGMYSSIVIKRSGTGLVVVLNFEP